MLNFQDVPQPAQHVRTLRRYMKLLGKIAGRWFTMSARLQNCLMAHKWILSDELNKRRTVTNFVPRLLIDDQKHHCVEICKELQEQIRNNPEFLSSVVTGDGTWIYGYDPETKQQVSQTTKKEKKKCVKWEATSTQCRSLSLMSME